MAASNTRDRMNVCTASMQATRCCSSRVLLRCSRYTGARLPRSVAASGQPLLRRRRDLAVSAAPLINNGLPGQPTEWQPPSETPTNPPGVPGEVPAITPQPPNEINPGSRPDEYQPPGRIAPPTRPTQDPEPTRPAEPGSPARPEPSEAPQPSEPPPARPKEQ